MLLRKNIISPKKSYLPSMFYIFALAFGLVFFFPPAIHASSNCGKIHFGGLLNANNSSLRLHSRRLTFARQTGNIIGKTSRTWNTYVPYDLTKAELHIKKLKKGGEVQVTVCKHNNEGDPGVQIDRFTIGAGTAKDTRITKNLSQLEDKYVSVLIKGENTTKSFKYQIRLKRPNQGKKWVSPYKGKKYGEVKGFADLHNHQVSALGFGGAFNPSYIHGSHEGPLNSCDGIHTGLIGLAAATGAHRSYPSNDSRKPNKWWPHYADGSHPQSHIDHLREAHKKGLKLLLATAVSNQALCILSEIPDIPGVIRSTSKKRKLNCDDMDAAKWQIYALHKFDKKYDWYEIVKDPWHARKVINEGKLAVVLGVEVSNVMPASHGEWEDQFAELYDMGVRSMELAHEADSEFSGNAHQHGMMFKILNVVKRTARPFKQIGKPALKHLRDTLVRDGDKTGKIFDINEYFEYAFKTRSPKFCDEKYRHQGIDCNKVGLSFKGEKLVQKMMDHNMLIPLDHVSRRSRKEIYQISKKNKYYPLIGTHTRMDGAMNPAERQGGSGSHEYMFTDDDLTKVRSTGGLVGFITSDKSMVELPGCINRPLTCWGSSQSMAQNVCYAAKTGVAVSLGSDFSGPVTMTAPRYSHKSKRTRRWDGLPAACPRNVSFGLVDPFGYKEEYAEYEPEMRSASEWSFDVRGQAHTGFSDDLISDIESLGAPVGETRLNYAAESFIRTWQRTFPDQRRGKLSDRAYRRFMATEVKAFGEALPAPDYDHHLEALYKKCIKLKEKGNKKCDSRKDWEQMLIAHQKDLENKCGMGRKKVAYINEVLYCQKSIPKAISRRSCERTKVDGIGGILNMLPGYCVWNQLYKGNKHYLARRLKENKCPLGKTVIKGKRDSAKPYCKELIARPIKAEKCDDWDGNITDEVVGYCVKDEGSYFWARKLTGFNKWGEQKCPIGHNRVQFKSKDDTLYCKPIGNIAISEKTCKDKKKGKTNKVDGHCTKKVGSYFKAWRLKGFNKTGERKCLTPYYKMQVQGAVTDLLCQAKPMIAIREEKCKDKKGDLNKVKGYCAFDKGDWFLMRKLTGRKKSGETKCPTGLVRTDLIPGSGIKFCKALVSTKISKDICSKKKGNIKSNLPGYCQLAVKDYIRVWSLKGTTILGEKSYQCPVGLKKVVVVGEKLYCRKLISKKITEASCRSERGSLAGLEGHCSFKKDFYYLVREIDAVNSAGRPTCPTGYFYEVRNPLNKDRCKRTNRKYSALKCNLLPTDKSKNWTGPHAKSGKDECRSKKGKKPKSVKCSTGYRLEIRSTSDRCVKITTETKTPVCPSGFKYKSKKGTDECIK